MVKKVGPKFGERKVIDNPIPSHLTLKYPFKTNKISEIEQVIPKYVKKQKPAKMKLEGFGNFRRFVAYSKVVVSIGAIKIQKGLIKELKKIKWLKIEKRESVWKPHSTITFGFTKKSFNKIWDYLQTQEQPEFNLKFDNITIMKKPRKYWKLHKTYKIK